MKQINLHWINAKTIPYLIIGALVFALFFQNSCSDTTPKTRIVKVTVPEVKGTFKPEKPIHDTIMIAKTIVKWKEKEIEIENPINMEIFNKYTKAKDSLERMAILLKAIEIKEFSKDFEDENLKLTAKGTVQGEVQSIGFDYTIKEKTIEAEIKEKQTMFKILSGVESGITKEFDKFAVKANVEFENKNGQSVIIGVDTEQRIWLGYKFKILHIRW